MTARLPSMDKVSDLKLLLFKITVTTASWSKISKMFCGWQGGRWVRCFCQAVRPEFIPRTLRSYLLLCVSARTRTCVCMCVCERARACVHVCV